MAVHCEDAARFARRDHYVALFARFELVVEPLCRSRRRIERGRSQESIIGPILIPIVAYRVLIIPIQLPGIGVEEIVESLKRSTGPEVGTENGSPWRSTRVFGVGFATP